MFLLICIKSGTRVKATTRKEVTETILVKRSEGGSYVDTLRMVKDEVSKTEGLRNSIRDVKESCGGDLVLVVVRQP